VRARWLIAGVGTALILAAGWFFSARKKHVPAPQVSAPTEATFVGMVQPQILKQVEAPIAGILDSWFLDVGQEVYEDQLVGRIRNPDLDAALQKAQAEVDRAQILIAQLNVQSTNGKLEVSSTAASQIRADSEFERIGGIYQRYVKLMQADAIARLTFEKTEADYKAAKKEAAERDAAAKQAQDKAARTEQDLEEAKKSLPNWQNALEDAKDAVAEGELHSPGDGVVFARNVHPGDRVEESAKELMTVATDLTKLAVTLTPDASTLARIRAGQHAFVRLNDAELPGEVYEIRGTEVIVHFMSPSPVLKLGTLAQVRIVF
jgi:multidrug resistance efflux pump